jgi:hypothetical protein
MQPKKEITSLGLLNLTETVVVACWYIWWQCREAVKGGKVVDPRQTAFAINVLTSNYVPASSAHAVVKKIMWAKPERDCLKLNIYAAFHRDGTGAAGIVLRNDQGEAIAGYACSIVQSLNSTMAEAHALLCSI